MIDFEQYLVKKAENEPHEVAELICLKCFDRAIHVYPELCLKNGAGKGCLKHAEEYGQIVEWLTELKHWREQSK